MFFYPNVLNHRTGRFATIWLAATKARKMKRRDLLKVNVQSTCNDIMNYVLVRVPPLSPGLPRPRFSLYLSSQLQYGVVLVYHRQCELLLEEIQEAIDRLHRYRIKVQIDMLPDDIRQTHTLPDALTLLNETEGARDPFFGLMEFGLPSPSSLIQLAEEMQVVPPEPSPPADGITASQESITMPELEAAALPEPEFEGQELQDFDMIDMLLEQPDQFPEGEAGQRERERETEEAIEREREAREVERTTDITGSTISVEPAQITEVPSRELVSVPEEDLVLPAEIPGPAERERTPEPVPIPPSPLSPERRARVTESPALAELVPGSPERPAMPRRRRRRQLMFFDEDMQISQEALQAQISDPRTEIRNLEDVLLKEPELIMAQTLLNNPCMTLPPAILELWKQGAVLHRIPPPRRRRVLVEEDQEAVRERERVREESDEGELREMVEAGLARYDTPVSSLVMETTDREISPMETPETRRSPVPIVPESVPGLEDIPEERVPELEEVMMEAEDPLRRLKALGVEPVMFRSLLPPKVKRKTVAQLFWRLLERIDKKEVTAQQDELYGDIIISLVQRPPQMLTEGE